MSLNLIEILPKKYTVDENHLPIYSLKQKQKIIEKIPEVTDFSILTIWGCVNIIPGWFFLLKDNELFNAFVEHPLAKDTIKNCEATTKEKFNQGEYSAIKRATPLENFALLDYVLDSPYFFNFDVDKYKKLLDLSDISPDYDLLKYKSMYPLFVLNIFQKGLLEFNERKILMGLFPELKNTTPTIDPHKLEIASLNQLGLIPSLLDSIMSKNTYEEFLESSLIINEYIKMGAKTNYSLLTKSITKEAHSTSYSLNVKHFELKELMKIKNPQFADFYEKFQLKNELKNDLIINEKVKNKIKI